MDRILPAAVAIVLLSAVLASSHTDESTTLPDPIDMTSSATTADTTELPMPLSPVDTILESTTVTLSWSITRDSSYVVELRGRLLDTVEAEGYEVVMELDTGAYEWRVTGVDSGVAGTPSEWVSFRIREPLPVPTPISPIDDTLTSGAIEFLWSGAWQGEWEWRIDGDSSWSVLSADTLLVATLDSGNYTWQVRATEEGSGGAWSEPSALSIVPVADLPVVTPLAPLNRTVGTGLIRLVWISDWRKTFVIEMRGDTTFTASIAAYKYEVELNSEGTYEWRIRAVDGKALGPWSAWWSFSTSDDITDVERDGVVPEELDLR